MHNHTKKVGMYMGQEEKRIRRSKRKIDWFPFVCLGIAGYFVWTLVNQQMHINELDDSYASAQARLEAAQQVNRELQQEKSQLEDPVYIEKVARDELGMARSGEMPYISANSRK